ncbi:MAG: RsmE family RNA methyltransferase [Acidimicrobiia bacterium]
MTPASVRAAAHVFVASLDDELTISGNDGHHLARVLRLRPNEVVTAADGFGNWRAYLVRAVEGHAVHCSASAPVAFDEPLFPRVAIAFALTKSDKPETTVMHLTELGVDRIVPLLLTHSVVRWDATKALAAHERFVAKARDAAMQSRRSRVPVIEPVGTLDSLLDHPALVVADIDGVAPKVNPALTADPIGGEWCGVVGPEGGFHSDERTALVRSSPYPPLTIGRSVLRAETAALSIAALLCAARS